MYQCCENEENIELEEVNESVKVYICEVCGRRHREGFLDPIEIKVSHGDGNN